jgi:protein TonB
VQPSGSVKSAGSSAASGSDSELALEYQRKLRVHILAFFRYPDAAARDGAPLGDVQLSFEVDRAGRVRQMWVERSSGSDVLDEAALDTLRRATPLPPIPSGLPDRLTVHVPLLFNANG